MRSWWHIAFIVVITYDTLITGVGLEYRRLFLVSYVLEICNQFLIVFEIGLLDSESFSAEKSSLFNYP